MRTWTSAYPPDSASARYAGLPACMDQAAAPKCGRGRPRTPRIRRLPGTRASRPAWTRQQRRNADVDVRVPTRIRRLPGTRASRPARNWQQRRNADVDVRVPPRIRRLPGTRASRPAWTRQPRRNADVDVRVPPRFGGCAVCGPRRPACLPGQRFPVAELPYFGSRLQHVEDVTVLQHQFPLWRT